MKVFNVRLTGHDAADLVGELVEAGNGGGVQQLVRHLL